MSHTNRLCDQALKEFTQSIIGFSSYKRLIERLCTSNIISLLK